MKAVYESHPLALQFRSKRDETPLDLARHQQDDRRPLVGVPQHHRGIVEGVVGTHKPCRFTSSGSGRYVVYMNEVLVCSRVGDKGVRCAFLELSVFNIACGPGGVVIVQPLDALLTEKGVVLLYLSHQWRHDQLSRTIVIIHQYLSLSDPKFRGLVCWRSFTAPINAENLSCSVRGGP